MKKSRLQEIIKEEMRGLLIEQKISDITDEFLTNQNNLELAEKARDDAQKVFNKAYRESGKRGTELVSKFQKELATELMKKLKVTKDYGSGRGESLVELYVENGNGKVSIHNRKYLSNSNGIVVWMIRDERTLDVMKGNFDEKFAPKQASAFLIKKVQEFEKKFNSGIIWFKGK